MADKYVSNSGNNGNSGDSWPQAWETLDYAYGAITPGDTVNVADGNYEGILGNTHIATIGNPTIFLAAGNSVYINSVTSGATALIELNPGSGNSVEYMLFDGFILDGATIGDGRWGWRSFWTKGVTIQNMTIINTLYTGCQPARFLDFSMINVEIYNTGFTTQGTGHHAVYIEQAEATVWTNDNLIIRGCRVHDNNEDAFYFNPVFAAPQNALIENNITWGNGIGATGAPSFQLRAIQNSRIQNNLCYNENGTPQLIIMYGNDPDQGIVGETKDNVICNNTLIHPYGKAMGVKSVPTTTLHPTGNKIFNNILMGNGGAYFETGGASMSSQSIDSGSQIESSWNDALLSQLFEDVIGNGSNNDVTANDFHLKVGSPAYNIGAESAFGAAAPNLDFEGDTRY